ncbi:MAG: hypothetical protein KF873_03030 [Gemmataceae bacterium]|nr:hypothetical protein [Gemmataceae bacterium]
MKMKTCFTAVTAAILANTAFGQYRPPVRPPLPSTTPAILTATTAARPAPAPPMRVCAARRTQLIAPAVNGNSVTSNRPQHVYGIYRTDTTTGITRAQKYGISGGGIRGSGATGRTILHPSRDYSARALTQTRAFNAEAVRTGENATYHTRILRRIPPQPSGSPTARQLAVGTEKSLVTQARIKSESAVPKNILPQPYGFSRLPKK